MERIELKVIGKIKINGFVLIGILIEDDINGLMYYKKAYLGKKINGVINISEVDGFVSNSSLKTYNIFLKTDKKDIPEIIEGDKISIQ